MRLPEGTWFQPTEQFELNGERWLTNGQIALAAEDDGGVEKDRATFIRAIAASCSRDVDGFRRVGGYAITRNQKVFAGHFVDLVEAMYHGCVHKIQPDDLPGLASYHNGKLVSVLMCMRANVRQIDAGDSVCELPTCRGCVGANGADPSCKNCRGQGHTVCTCSCGDEHTIPCKCRCPRCDGTGSWRAPS